ncbi:biogenesis of lysosome-related organelles complex 1 subunit 5 [Acrasis kona]|uniref:Biogenesis of lysosome-related organelles complex 1 subunit 5 n=1 Tax=Acrasis kona TaxID=1008807 RepID=A0AAW2Z043_9EUKA
MFSSITSKAPQSNDQQQIGLGLESLLPENFYRIQQLLFTYHDEATREVSLLMQEYNDKRTDTSGLDKISFLQNTTTTGNEVIIPSINRAFRENQADISSGIKNCTSIIHNLQQREAAIKKSCEDSFEKSLSLMLSDKEAFLRDFVATEVQKINDWHDKSLKEIDAKYVFVPTLQKETSPKTESPPVAEKQETQPESTKIEETK